MAANLENTGVFWTFGYILSIALLTIIADRSILKIASSFRQDKTYVDTF